MEPDYDSKPQHAHPVSMEDYDLSKKDDLGALSTEMQNKLNLVKIKTRMDNEKYLRDHPELGELIKGFLSQCFIDRPQNVRTYAASFFTNPTLKDDIKTFTKQ